MGREHVTDETHVITQVPMTQEDIQNLLSAVDQLVDEPIRSVEVREKHGEEYCVSIAAKFGSTLTLFFRANSWGWELSRIAMA